MTRKQLRQSPATFVLLLFVYTIFPSALTAAAVRPAGLSDPVRRSEFYNIYVSALSQISLDMADRYDATSQAGLTVIADSIDTESALIRRLQLDTAVTTRSYDAERFSHYALAELLRYTTKYAVRPTTATLERFMHLNISHYPQKDWVFASAIHVKTADWGDQTSAVVSRLEAQLKSKSFAETAFQYYESIGQKSDGRLGRVMHGTVPDWEFKLLMSADPSRPFFGPFEAPDGYYFCKLEKKFTAGNDPLNYYAKQVEADYRRIYARETLKHMLQDQQKALAPQVFGFDTSSPARLQQIAYRVAGTSVTFEEAHRRLPFVAGDMNSPKFWDSVSSQSLQNDLLFYSAQAQDLRDSEEFRYLADAHRNAFLVHTYVEREIAKASINEEALRAFYRPRADKRYAQPDVVRLLVVRLPETSDSQGRTLREKMNSIRDAFVAKPTSDTIEQLRSSHPSLSCKEDPVPIPADKLGRILEMAIGTEKPGFVTPVLMGKDRACYFARIIARQPQPPTSFEQLRDQLRFEFVQHQREALTESLYGKGSFHKYFGD